MFNRSVDSFAPAIYKDVVEMNDIMNSEEHIMSIARQEMAAAFANTFILTSDETGVIMFEKMLNITADLKTEDLQFRRERVLNRLSTSPPFTFRFLKNKLDEIIGTGAWKAYIDFSNYTLYVESSASNQNWYSEVEFTINRIKPCNLVFTNVPYTAAGVKLNEEVSYTQLNWKYRLGSWRLGSTPFATFDGGGIAKMADTKSVKSALLEDAASFVAGDVHHVLLNDTITVSEFRLKQVSGNVASIEYTVLPNMTNLITNIKLMNADNEVLTEAFVYVPVTQTVISKHTITVKEGI